MSSNILTAAAEKLSAELASVALRTHPILKAVGGKGRLLPEILARMPTSYGRYIEPFFGGGALFFHLAPADALIADANADLIATYRAIVADVDAVIDMLERHRAAHCELHYYAVRAAYNDGARPWGAARRAAAYVYLNKTAWNGLYRVNRRGMFNVPMGRYKDPAICDADGLRAAALVLARAELRACDYRSTIESVQAGDFVVLDSPYDGTFSSYTAAPFGADEQVALAEAAKLLVDRGAQVMLHNADTPRVRQLYAGDVFAIDIVSRPGSISSNPDKRDAVAELIITGGYAR